MRTLLAVLVAAVPLASMPHLAAADWPMWRRDAARSARSPETLPSKLTLRWSRELPSLDPAWRNPRLGFDHGHEPIVADGRITIASSHDDSVTAFDLDTGAEVWKIHAGGPVRFAPVAWQGRAVFGSDDGKVYCVDAASGRLLWRSRAVPSRRKAIGNRRMISLWPVRGGPVIVDGTVYFAAGVWPFEGAFVEALDAKTGEVVWINDAAGYVYGSQPHNASGLGGLTPQGYLVADDDDLIVPCGTAYPARFDRRTGKLKSFALPKKSRHPGGWFAWMDPTKAKAVRRGELSFDTAVNRERHEDNLRLGDGEAGARRRIVAGEETLAFDDVKKRVTVDGDVHAMVAASGRLLVTTRDAKLLCFGAHDDGGEREPRHWKLAPPMPIAISSSIRSRSDEVMRLAGTRDGWALLVDPEGPATIASYADQTRWRIVALAPNAATATRWRTELAEADLLGTRVDVVEGDIADAGLPRWFASVVVVARGLGTAGESGVDSRRFLAVWSCVRPYGGVALVSSVKPTDLAVATESHDLAGSRVTDAGSNWTILRREGPVPGSTDYTGGWNSPDALVRAPLGVLWFDDVLAHFKRSPQPQFVSGVMVSNPKEWLPKVPRSSGSVGYQLLPAVYSDIYTGRVLSPQESKELATHIPGLDRSKRQPVQYRPATQKNAWKPKPPRPGQRVNPLTGKREPRTFPKDYGCDGGVDYGAIYGMRSATAAFYDKTCESGTVHISGPRSGCTNSVIPAGGVLNVPFFYAGCTCSYPLPAGLALASEPETFEQWATWGASEPQDVQRVGINLGAPGDRVTRDGTLWIDAPSRGGPSPKVPIAIAPQSARPWYRHSLWIEGGRGWPWVVASGVEGLESLTVRGLIAGTYTVRLFFAEPGLAQPGERMFDVAVGGSLLAERLDPVREAGGRLRGVVREVDGVRSTGAIDIRLTARAGATVLCGVEVIAAGLTHGDVPALPDRDTTLLETAAGPR